MKIQFIVVCFLCIAINTHAQRTEIMAFPITDYIIETDSVTVVQVKLPEGLQIKEKNFCLIKSVYSPGNDSVFTVGEGKCRLIKKEYYYFGFLKKDLKRKPAAGDLLYSDVMATAVNKGLLFYALKYSVTLNDVYEKLIADLNTVLKMHGAADEKAVVDLLVADVKFTGTEMAKQNNGQDRTIDKGKFKGKKLFAGMQTITNADITDFLKYMGARPEKYAGNAWKFSELMATWMDAGAPMVD